MTNTEHRYTDFLVNEILPSGRVLHLESVDLPEQGQSSVKNQEAETSSTDVQAVVEGAHEQGAQPSDGKDDEEANGESSPEVSNMTQAWI